MFYFPARGGQRMIAHLIRDAKVRYQEVKDEEGRIRRIEIGRLSRGTIH